MPTTGDERIARTNRALGAAFLSIPIVIACALVLFYVWGSSKDSVQGRCGLNPMLPFPIPEGIVGEGPLAGRITLLPIGRECLFELSDSSVRFATWMPFVEANALALITLALVALVAALVAFRRISRAALWVALPVLALMIAALLSAAGGSLTPPVCTSPEGCVVPAEDP